MTYRDSSGAVERLSSQLAANLREIIQGVSVGGNFEVCPGSDICHCLELFLPQELRARYPEWKGESLDGVFVARATKTSRSGAELIGTAVLISDQTATPFALELAEASGRVAIRRLGIGEAGGGALGISGPPANSDAARRLFEGILNRIDAVDWVYVVQEQDMQFRDGGRMGDSA
jgi:hypothetical protein